MKKIFISLRWEVTAVISGLALAAVAALGYFAMAAQEKSLMAEMELRGSALAGTAANNAADYLLIKYDIEAAKIMKESLSNKGVVYAFVAGPDGKIIVHNDMMMAGRKYAEALSGRQLPKDKNTLYTDAAGRKTLDFTRPVVSKRKVFIGTLHLGMSYALIEDALRQAYTKIMYVTIAILLIAVLAGFFLGSRIAGPVLLLAKGAETVGAGNFDHEIKIKSNNELGALASTFNSMTRGLKKAQQDAVAREIMDKELKIAREIQLSLIPEKMPPVPGYSAAAFYRATKTVGGDYYDAIPLDRGRTGFVMADVSGKGVPAALVMAMASGILRSQAPLSADPKECLVKFNCELFKRIKRGMFLTVFYGILDNKNNTLEFVSAGHCEPFIYRQKLQKAEVVSAQGFPAGIGSGPEYLETVLEKKSIAMEPGDTAVIYTDGLFEAMDLREQQFGLERLRRAIEKNSRLGAEQLKEAVIKELSGFTMDAEQSDDMAMLIIERQG